MIMNNKCHNERMRPPQPHHNKIEPFLRRQNPHFKPDEKCPPLNFVDMQGNLTALPGSLIIRIYVFLNETIIPGILHPTRKRMSLSLL